MSLLEMLELSEFLESQMIDINNDPYMYELMQDIMYISIAMSTGDICPCIAVRGSINNAGAV